MRFVVNPKRKIDSESLRQANAFPTWQVTIPASVIVVAVRYKAFELSSGKPKCQPANHKTIRYPESESAASKMPSHAYARRSVGRLSKRSPRCRGGLVITPPSGR